MVWKGSGDPSPNFFGSGAVIFRGLGVQCGRMNVVYFTPPLITGGSGQSCWSVPHIFNSYPVYPVTDYKPTFVPRPNPIPKPKPNPKSHCNRSNRLIFNSYTVWIENKRPNPLWDSLVYLGHLYAADCGVWWIPSPNIFGSGAVRCGVSSDRLPLGCMALAAENVNWRLWNKLGPRQCV